jgi:hypothetical protein
MGEERPLRLGGQRLVAAVAGTLGLTLVSALMAVRDQACFQETIANGRPGTSRPPSDGLLSPQQIEDVIAFLRSKQ